jgi:hypothetical protein
MSKNIEYREKTMSYPRNHKKRAIWLIAPAALAVMLQVPTHAQNEFAYQPGGYAVPSVPPESKSIFLTALIPALTGQVVGVLAQGAGCVFSRLFSFMGARPNFNCIDPAQGANNAPMNNQFQQGQPVYGQQQYGQPQQYMQQGYGQQQQQFAQQPYGQPQQFIQQQPVQQPMTQPYAAPAAANGGFTSTMAADAARQPVFSFVIQKLSNAAVGAEMLGMLASQPLQAGEEPAFDIVTDQAFAVLFATSVPGRVRMINTDGDQVVATSSVYEAIPANDNRMPRVHEGGILMTGKPGTEWLDVEFTPCVSPSLQQNPVVAGFVGVLNPCGGEAATKQYPPAMANGKGGAAAFGGKAMAFPMGADPSQPVALAPSNYAKGDTLRFRIKINHQPKV